MHLQYNRASTVIVELSVLFLFFQQLFQPQNYELYANHFGVIDNQPITINLTVRCTDDLETDFFDIIRVNILNENEPPRFDSNWETSEIHVISIEENLPAG